MKKLRFQDGSGLTPEWRNLLAAFERTLRLLHPLMPFITEELWQRLTVNVEGRPKSLALARYPQYDSRLGDPAAEEQVAALQDIVTSARNLRAEMKLDPKQQVEGSLFSRGPATAAARQNEQAIRKLANLKLEITE